MSASTRNNRPFRRVVSISLDRERAMIFFGPSPMLPEPSTTDTGTNDAPSMGASPGSESFLRPPSANQSDACLCAPWKMRPMTISFEPTL
jgi:hypothetical protein